MSDPIQPILPSSTDELAPKQTPAPPPAEALEPLKDEATTSNAPAIDIKALTDRTLDFLATANNETLGACLVGLGAGTYLVLGRVGLILIGVVGGVVLHATWEGQTRSDGDDKAQSQAEKKRERGIDVAHRILDWRDTRTRDKGNSGEGESDLDVKLYLGKQLDYSDFRPKTAAALTELTDAVIRDYVKYVHRLSQFGNANNIQMVVFTHLTHRNFIPCLMSPDSNRLPHIRLLAPFPQAACR